MNENELENYANKVRYVSDYRGAIIQTMIECESIVEDALAFYYCGADLNRRKEFIHSILGQEQFGLTRKKDHLCFVMKRNEFGFDTAAVKSFDSEFTVLINLRNACAHRKYFGDGDAVNEDTDFSFSLDSYSVDGKEFAIKPVKKTETECLQDINNCYKMRTVLEGIKDKIVSSVEARG
jgi:hypothetical protein